MEKLKNAFWNALIARLTILLEFEPGDAVQDGYFQYLDELRNGAATARESAASRRTESAAGSVRTQSAGTLVGYGNS